MVLRLCLFGLGCLCSSLSVGLLLELVLGESLYRIRVLPANCEKSTITSALQLVLTSECISVEMPKSKVPWFQFQSAGCVGRTAGAGRKPASVPIWMNDGPMLVGSGTPPSLPSVGQPAG